MKPEELGAYYESILDKELRKEGGVYYTPQYIVDYIVEHTLGKLLQGKTPKEAARIKVVVPACGHDPFAIWRKGDGIDPSFMSLEFNERDLRCQYTCNE